MEYQRLILSGTAIDGPPGLPSALVGLADESLADLASALDPCPAEYVGIGYWPIQPAEPTPIYKVAVSRAPAFVEGVLKWVEELADAPPAPLMPISPRQMLIALYSIGITEEMVEAEIVAIGDADQRAIALIEWRRAGTIDRDHPLITDLATTFALPPEQIDALWRWAASL